MHVPDEKSKTGFLHFLQKVYGLNIVMEDSPDFFKIRIPDPIRFLGLKKRIFPDPKLKAFKVQFLGIFWAFFGHFFAKTIVFA
jgi:hypothetical protein